MKGDFLTQREKKMTIPEDLIQLHEDLVEFGVKVQQKSSDKMEKGRHIEDHVYMAFYRLQMFVFLFLA